MTDTQAPEPSPPRPSPGPPLARGRDRDRAPGAYLRLALWQRLVLSLGIAAALIIALVLYVSAHNSDSPPTSQQNPAAELQANREAQILVAQDQAPHVTPLKTSAAPATALAASVRAQVSRQVIAGALPGPTGRARCTAAGPPRAGRRAFSCRVTAGHVSYPFFGVVDTTARRITYCKRDVSALPSQDVPVSPRCRA